jgi:2-polyprenyl-6-hydroxyphenyl methylase/3-demethylubiquinone-9 3-methyltransferase
MFSSAAGKYHVSTVDRFEFGRNWQQFADRMSPARIADAEESLCSMLRTRGLAGQRFLDVGCGSGLFSLAARRLGAVVHSFDFDRVAVATAIELRRRFFPEEREWSIEQGSVLDRSYLESLGHFDVVYAWGVLHHTGALWEALANAISCVGERGQLFIAIYNDQGWTSRYWTGVKRLYNHHRWTRPILVGLHAPYLIAGPIVVRILAGRRAKAERGMARWHDLIDWLGGWPFEVARPEEIAGCMSRFGLVMTGQRLCGRRQGCNEFVFERVSGVDVTLRAGNQQVI